MAREKTKLPRGGLQKVPTGIAGLAGADLLIQDPKELLSLVSSNPLLQ